MDSRLAGITMVTARTVAMLPHVTVFGGLDGRLSGGDCFQSQLAGRRPLCVCVRLSSPCFSSSVSYSSFSKLRDFCAAVMVSSKRARLRCASRSTGSSDSVTGGGGGGGFGGETSGDGSEGVDSTVKLGAGASTVSSDVIILDVQGMMCEGCTASVTKILEGQPRVSSASVDLTTQAATVWPLSGAKAVPNWNKEIGEALAKHLTACGFKSTFRDHEAVDENISP